MEATRLRQILELEGQRGFADTVVFGGLDRFLANWFKQDDRILAASSALTRPLPPRL